MFSWLGICHWCIFKSPAGNNISIEKKQVLHWIEFDTVTWKLLWLWPVAVKTWKLNITWKTMSGEKKNVYDKCSRQLVAIETPFLNYDKLRNCNLETIYTAIVFFIHCLFVVVVWLKMIDFCFACNLWTYWKTYPARHRNSDPTCMIRNWI